MFFSINEAKKLANLAKLSFSINEIINLRKDLENIVSHFKMLNELDVSNVEPIEHVGLTKFFMRNDKVKPVIGLDGLKNCVSTKNCLIKVPKIIK